MNKFQMFKAGLITLFAISSFTVHAQEWPTKRTISLVVPFAPGGSTDATARVLSERLSKEIGQQLIVENKAGAGGNVGATYVAKSTPDGYTVLFSTSTMATNMSLYKNAGFDLQKDLIPVSEVAVIPNVLTVNKDFPAKNLQEFIDIVRQKKDPINYGSAGGGSASHLSGALFNNMVKGDMVHVAYKGGAPANTDLMGGQIQAVFAPLVEVLPYIESGKLRALGVTTKGRSPRLPNVPAIGELIPGYEIALWNGVFLPAETPSEVVNKLSIAVQKVVKEPAFRKVLLDQGSIPVGNTAPEFKKYVDEEVAKWNRIVKLSGATVD